MMEGGSPYEINANGRNVVLREAVILNHGLVYFLRELTANLTRRQDLPTHVSPIKTSLNR